MDINRDKNDLRIVYLVQNCQFDLLQAPNRSKFACAKLRHQRRVRLAVVELIENCWSLQALQQSFKSCCGQNISTQKKQVCGNIRPHARSSSVSPGDVYSSAISSGPLLAHSHSVGSSSSFGRLQSISLGTICPPHVSLRLCSWESFDNPE